MVPEPTGEEHNRPDCFLLSSLISSNALRTRATEEEGRSLHFSLVAHVLAVGGGVLAERGVLWRGGGGQVQAPVAVAAAAVVVVVVLLLHMSVCHLLPQLLQLRWNYACDKQTGIIKSISS